MADMLTALRAVGASQALALQWAEPMAAAAARYQITDWKRLAAWLAQCSHESARFTRLEEGLVYLSAQRIVQVFGKRLAPIAAELVRAPQALANAAYADRLGNGPRASGDGWRYRGRGLIQLTGRDNYRAAGRALSWAWRSSPTWCCGRTSRRSPPRGSGPRAAATRSPTRATSAAARGS